MLACQYIDSNGFFSENGRWSRAGFNNDPPFFLKVVDGQLDETSIAAFLGVDRLVCLSPPLDSDLQTCVDDLGGALHFRHSSGNGAEAQMFGASQHSSDARRDTVAVRLFTCQRM